MPFKTISDQLMATHTTRRNNKKKQTSKNMQKHTQKWS